MRIWRLTALCSLLFLMHPAAWACTCFAPSAKTALGRVDVVFRGTLIEHKERSAIFRVREQWKGNLGADIEVEWREGDNGDCNGFWTEYLKIGNELLVFATRGAGGIYRTSICLPTKFVAEAQTELHELGPGSPPRSAEKSKQHP